jgi:hypothetical protein
MDGLETAISILLNEAMKVERSRALGAEPWQRSEQRLGYANGYKPKSLSTRIGKLSLQVPKVRGDVAFYPSSPPTAAPPTCRPRPAARNPGGKELVNYPWHKGMWFERLVGYALVQCGADDVQTQLKTAWSQVIREKIQAT